MAAWFHLYPLNVVSDDIRDKLIAKGIPAEEIAYIHDAKTEKQKADLFEKVRNGKIRVLLGSVDCAPYEQVNILILNAEYYFYLIAIMRDIDHFDYFGSNIVLFLHRKRIPYR